MICGLGACQPSGRLLAMINRTGSAGIAVQNRYLKVSAAVQNKKARQSFTNCLTIYIVIIYLGVALKLVRQ